MAAQFNIHDAKTHLSELIERASQGEDIVIARAGKPVVRLIAYRERTEPRPLGIYDGRVEVPDDLDDLPAEIQAAFEGEAPATPSTGS